MLTADIKVAGSAVKRLRFLFSLALSRYAVATHREIIAKV